MIRKLLILSLFIFISKIQFSQDYQGFGLWNSISVEKKVAKGITSKFTEALRLKDNASRVNLFYSEVGLEYKLMKGVKTSLTYRITQRLEDENYFSYRHRINWDISAKKGFGSFQIQYRHRLQAELKKYYSSKYGKLPFYDSRHKMELKYELNKRFEPYVSTELFIQLKDPKYMYGNLMWNRLRYQAGLDINFGSRKKLGLFYMIQNEFNIPEAKDSYNIGIEFTLQL